jgi:flagellar biosynthesis/type III secretory pathway protein FliH
MKKVTLHLDSPIKTIHISTDNGPEPCTAMAVPAASASEEQLQQAYARGYQEGMAAHQELDKLCQSLVVQGAGVEKQWQEFLATLEPQLLELSLKILEHLLLREIEAGRYDIVRICDKVFAELRMIPALNVLELHCHPDDIAVITKQAGRYGEIHFIANTRVGRGDCLVKTNLGQVVVTLHDRLRQIETLFREASVC